MYCAFNVAIAQLSGHLFVDLISLYVMLMEVFGRKPPTQLLLWMFNKKRVEMVAWPI